MKIIKFLDWKLGILYRSLTLTSVTCVNREGLKDMQQFSPAFYKEVIIPKWEKWAKLTAWKNVDRPEWVIFSDNYTKATIHVGGFKKRYTKWKREEGKATEKLRGGSGKLLADGVMEKDSAGEWAVFVFPTSPLSGAEIKFINGLWKHKPIGIYIP